MNKNFSSQRLSYFPISLDDLGFFHALHTDKEVMELTYGDAHEDIGHSEKLLENIINSEDILWIVKLSDSKTPIGFVGFHSILKHDLGGVMELGYSLMPEYWGNGYATEMGHRAIQHVFEMTKNHKITATCNEENRASQKVLEKLGMKKEGIARSMRYKNGKWMDEVQFGILTEEWRNYNS